MQEAKVSLFDDIYKFEFQILLETIRGGLSNPPLIV